MGADDRDATSGTGPSAVLPPLVLIVDDEEPIAEAIALIVAEAGYRPLVALHGQKALELARGQRPALIITDVMMPLLDGVGLITALRADEISGGHPPTPIIAMTAANAERVRNAGADVVLRKPFNLEELEVLIFRLVRQAVR
ncbi:MAG: response regulator [Ktedonobacterales bacterium]|nr:response regulator [Ktedonobacterales bacterium]